MMLHGEVSIQKDEIKRAIIEYIIRNSTFESTDIAGVDFRLNDGEISYAVVTLGAKEIEL